VPQIEVTFDIDANGILQVSAQDKATGQRQSITITGSGNLSKEEIERMVREAEANAEADRRMQEAAELKNRAEQLAYQTEKTIREAGDKISEADRSRVEEKVATLRKAVAEDNQDEIQQAFTDLEAESHTIAEQLYKAATESGGASEEEEPPKAGVGAQDGDVIDAEFKEEK
ncbi:MAG TPA: Hsp70 family protein, partial [Fimbriimonadaceae bacterium]|nr:Hsp70 family protein [Fimbriimonadaceae bacterium]